jgi:glycine/D-amino acid oxidase-like deaminating enzyme/nitrite reductase/ring-hydroxylating ferredoxin subunit
MNDREIPSRSLWSATARMPAYPPLAANLTADVCVIGGGIAGLTTAYLLARDGLSVALVEARQLGEGETGRTTAHLAVPDDRYWHIEKSYGQAAAASVADSFARAIDLIEAIVREESIDCEFERLDGYLFSCAENPLAVLDRELAAARRAGVAATREAQLPIARLSNGPCLRFARQAQFHPLKYLAGLACAAERRRAHIYMATAALDIVERDGNVIVTTTGGKIVANSAVVATNTPINDRVAIHLKQAAYQTYVVAARVPRGAIPHVLMWDDGDPYHYVRIAASEDEDTEYLIVGGEDHKTGQDPHPERRFDALGRWLRERFPMAGPVSMHWSGEVMEPLDGIAYLGRNPGNREIYIITGDSGNGMTHATAGAILVADLIMGRVNPWLHTYDPARKAFKETLEFVKRQSNVAAQYMDWISDGDEPGAAAIPPGEGALIRSGLKKIAAYRDQEGALHCHSATCPHLGCVVQWNRAEKTWDCPCHGSRFSAYGSVLHGPAVSRLAPLSDAEWQRLTQPVGDAGSRSEQKTPRMPDL